MVDRDTLSSRLDALEGYLRALHGFRAHPRERFVADPALHHHAERLLHLACECTLDIAHHVIAEQGWCQPASYRDAMQVLCDHGLIDAALAARMQRWMGFRNLLVHFYLALDHGRCHDAIREDLGDLQAFAGRMATLL